MKQLQSKNVNFNSININGNIDSLRSAVTETFRLYGTTIRDFRQSIITKTVSTESITLNIT